MLLGILRLMTWRNAKPENVGSQERMKTGGAKNFL